MPLSPVFVVVVQLLPERLLVVPLRKQDGDFVLDHVLVVQPFGFLSDVDLLFVVVHQRLLCSELFSCQAAVSVGKHTDVVSVFTQYFV